MNHNQCSTWLVHFLEVHGVHKNQNRFFAERSLATRAFPPVALRVHPTKLTPLLENGDSINKII